MTELTVRDFGAYFAAVHGHTPFPWQERLLREVAGDGRWPDLLDLPTGSGKTAAIDIALFHLALDAAAPPAERRAPRRIVLVVDRRTIVDQAFRRARHIRAALQEAEDGVLAEVSRRLCALGGSVEEPLFATQLRGGIPRDDGWARRPDQPVVAVSTVDQVGSRLLFRGYGVSEATRSIHAGLLGEDTLFLLDEVHLSAPFLATLKDVELHRKTRGAAMPDRWQVVPMSATSSTTLRPFTLAAEDDADDRLRRRLEASKPAECVEVKVSGHAHVRAERFADELVAKTLALAAPGRVIGVVVNRVALARAVYRKLDREKNTCFLLTGRMRPLDRDARERVVGPLVCSGRARAREGKPVIVVATQCIEAGADYDFDALVTECASLDALRQRFGRLNRLGDVAEARAIILARSDSVTDDDDPIYGSALPATWKWLNAKPRDFGVRALSNVLPTGEELARMTPAQSTAPVMLPAHLDLWSQTKPTPSVDPDVALWLHGIDRPQDIDVQLVWRADVTEELLDAGPASADLLSARIQVVAPSGLEALSVPLAAARAWLARQAAPEVADVDGANRPPAPREDARGVGERLALAWRGEDSRIVGPRDLRPGMTLVVPATYGGITDGNWDPASDAPVIDLGDEAHWMRTGRAALRVHRDVWGPNADGAPASLPARPREDEDAPDIEELLSMIEPAATGVRAEIVKGLRQQKKKWVALVDLPPIPLHGKAETTAKAEPAEAPGYLALVSRRRSADGDEASSADDGASMSGVAVSLTVHMEGVRSWAGAFALRCGLSAELVADLELAARWHDAGKADPRFQRMLHGGSPLADVEDEPLAKSRMVNADLAARTRARERSGYPAGARHELSSVALLERADHVLSRAHDRELVLHLVGSHHGWCRPFAPVVEDEAPVEVSLAIEGTVVTTSSRHGLDDIGAGIADRYWTLVQRYGWYGLAWLEAILRLADHRRSEEEQRG